MTKLENALIWIYVKTWGKYGNHIIVEKDLWNFADGDLETAIMSLAYPRKQERPERIQDLSDLIMEKFEEGGMAAFREWSGRIHDQIIETLPQIDSDEINADKHIVASQLSLITDEMKQFERQTKENLARLSSLATNLLAGQVHLTKIQKWSPGKYDNSFCGIATF